MGTRSSMSRRCDTSVSSRATRRTSLRAVEPMRVLATAPLRGPGLDHLRSIAEVIEDSWLAHSPIRLYDAKGLAERLTEEGTNVVICEADRCSGPVMDLELVAICSTRGAPDNVDIPAATAKGIP